MKKNSQSDWCLLIKILPNKSFFFFTFLKEKKISHLIRLQNFQPQSFFILFYFNMQKSTADLFNIFLYSCVVLLNTDSKESQNKQKVLNWSVWIKNSMKMRGVDQGEISPCVNIFWFYSWKKKNVNQPWIEEKTLLFT